MNDDLRLMVYDRTCTGRPFLPGLSHAWGAGAWLYRGLRRFDAHFGAASWPEALRWLATVESSRRIREIQYWGHGKWGRALIARSGLGVDALEKGHELHETLEAIRGRLTRAGEALWWFRTCELFGADAGHRFAREWTRFFGCRGAGHTFVIGQWQSGLHSLQPGDQPEWSATEGIKRGTAEKPEQAYGSGMRRPNTVSFLSGGVPRGY